MNFDVKFQEESSFTVEMGQLTRGPKGDPGKDGEPGKDGITPTIGENGNWFLGDEDTGKPSRGEKGETVQPDWAQNDETAKDYVKNRPFYSKGTARGVLGKDFDAWKACVLAHGGEISENDPAGWPITFNYKGVDYNVTGSYYDEGKNITYTLTKIPALASASIYAIMVTAFSEPHRVTVAKGNEELLNDLLDFVIPAKEEVKYLSPKFIKDMYYEEMDSGNVQVCTFEAGRSTPKDVTLSEPLIEGATYEVLFDGTYRTEEVCTRGGAANNELLLLIQKSSQDYYGTLVAEDAASTAIQYQGNPSKVANITVTRITPKIAGIHQIPAKYIPPLEPLTVTFTKDDDGSWSADKTFAEVKAAIEAGRFVQAAVADNGLVYPFYTATNNQIGFLRTFVMGDANEIPLIGQRAFALAPDESVFLYNVNHQVLSTDGLPAKTDDMTQPVGVDGNGKLWTAPGGGSVTADGITTALGYTPRKAWYVKLTGTKASPTADQTAAAIYQAYTDGYAVYGIVQMSEILEGFPIILPLLYAYGSSESVGALCFAGSANPHLSGTMEQNTTITATYDDSWHVFVDSQPDSYTLTDEDKQDIADLVIADGIEATLGDFPTWTGGSY